MLFRATFILSLFCTCVAQAPRNFIVEQGETPKLMCNLGGGTCRFLGSEFSDGLIDADTGGTTQVIRNENGQFVTVWGPQQDFNSDFLLLPPCKSETCWLKCQEVCDCTLPDGTQCTENSPSPTRAPVVIPPTQAPKVECTTSTDVSSCPQLMQKLPVGVDCDCHNFCGGEFLSCSGGSTTCVTDKPDGDMMGRVIGCTMDHKMKGQNGPSSSSTLSLSLPLLVGTLLIFGLRR